ncbi:MAG TPA: alcohol dehydrogenase catalytic domain-containing protein [Amnibacterium sp.]|nr:alcohol dehydrogenase catalytic domain-containing protein [Amnibacterium sp.]
MRALVASGARELRIEDRDPDPSLGPVVFRPLYGGICGSDLHYSREGRVGAFAILEPLVLGHEVVGVVEEDPTGRFPAGTRATLHPGTSCGTCPECASGRPNLCRFARYLGSAASVPHTQGAFAERVMVRPDQVRALPEALPTLRGVLAEPLGVGLHAIGRAGGVAGRRVLVSGAGPIGLLAAGAAVALGAGSVTVADVLAEPLATAALLGATATVHLRDAAPEPAGYDVVIEAAGVPAALTAAVAATTRGGTVVQVGMLPAHPEPVALSALVSREIELRGAFRFDDEIDDAVAMLADLPVFDAVITHVLPLGAYQEAFDIAADSARSSKVVLWMGDD